MTEHLFRPITLAGRTLPNRIAFAALTTRLPRDGAVSDALIDHLEARAAGGAAMVVTEALAACRSSALPVRVSVFDEDKLPGLVRLAEAVGRHGAALIGQLWHSGNAHLRGRPSVSVGPSAVADASSWTVPRALTDGEVEGLVEEYADSAARLQRAGFAGVELSAAHGFLPLQFLSPVTNKRADRWGGDVMGRSAFTRAILRAIRERCGAGFILGLKLPADDGVPGSITPAEAARLTALIVADTPPDLICYSQGSHGPSLWMHSPDMHEPPMPFRAAWAPLRQAAGAVPMAAIGRITSPAMAEATLSSGDADLVMLGRPLFADPEWPAKVRAGRAAAIRPCIYCNACWGEIHRGGAVACSINPRGGTGTDVRPAPPRVAAPRRVVVVGAGVAGLHASAVAAERGHRVTLVTGGRTGGAARLHAQLPGCGDIAPYLKHLDARAAAAGVERRDGPSATADAVLADLVILATGATMVRPRGAGPDAPDLRRAVAELSLNGLVQDGTAVLFDQDHTAATYAAAELLLARFARVVLLTPRETIASEVPLISAQGIFRRFARAGKRFTLLPHSELAGAGDGTVAVRNVLTGEESGIDDVALVTFSTPREPRLALRAGIEARGIPVQVVGDAVMPRSMLWTVRDAQAVGEQA
ncbi:hypothetical protein [Muricoccus radiodurans]|uniref:oxidoreductase n=1 Tax=Muricoccus radiodurans TaxID=2231721 RepID=UPI003CF124DA